MIGSQAQVGTAAASRYLQQLCKHFAHKISVEYDSSRGRADFPFGTCHMTAADGVLTMRCEAPDETALARMQDVLVEHLVRFAWREKLSIEWNPIQA